MNSGNPIPGNIQTTMNIHWQSAWDSWKKIIEGIREFNPEKIWDVLMNFGFHVENVIVVVHYEYNPTDDDPREYDINITSIYSDHPRFNPDNIDLIDMDIIHDQILEIHRE